MYVINADTYYLPPTGRGRCSKTASFNSLFPTEKNEEGVKQSNFGVCMKM
jgi:hypothetical protein